MPDRSFTVGRYLIERLGQAGVKHIFGVPGDYVLDLMDCVVEGPMDFVGTCNELNAGYAADGNARLNGIGTAMVTYGVGALSLVNAVAGAYAERVPLVVISGAPHSAQRKAHLPMHHLATDYRLQLDIFSRLTACAVLLRESDSACDQIDRAIATCLREKRPVYIEVPVDMVAKTCRAPKKLCQPIKPKSDPEALTECVAESISLLGQAGSSAILAGVEIHRFDLQEEVVALLDTCGYPVASTVNGKTAIPEEHPQFIGIYEGGVSREAVRDIIESADCLLSLGAWFTDIATGGFTAKIDESRMIVANSDRVKIKHHHYDHVYLHDFIPALNEALSPASIRHKSASPHKVQGVFVPDPKAPITIDRFFERLNHFLSDEMVLVAGTGDAMFGAAELHTNKPESFVAQANYLSIGYSLPAGLGVAMARPDKRTIICIGDGAFQMTTQCLSTLIRSGRAPIIFLLNNDGYGIERIIHDGPYNEIQRWRYHELPAVFDGKIGCEVRTESDLESALKDALAKPEELAFIEIIVDRADCTTAVKRLGAAVRKQSTNA